LPIAHKILIKTQGLKLSLFCLQVFVWIGKEANETERQESVKSGKSNQPGRILRELASIVLKQMKRY